jgi:RNA polymerase sigma-70 factor (ECF subfamily)
MAEESRPEDWSWDRYRNYLRLLAWMEMDDRLQAKMDPSDLAQQAVLNAIKGLPDFRGKTEQERLAWLRRILAHCLADQVDHFQAGMRRVDLEVSLDKALDDSSAGIGRWVAANIRSAVDQAAHHELCQQFADALAQLPDMEQQVLNRKYFRNESISEIARQLNQDRRETSRLLRIALEQLRGLIKDSP